MNLLAILNPYRWIAAAALIAALVIGIPLAKHHYDATQQKVGYDKAQSEFRDAADKEREAKAKEGLRRLEQQQENQRAQDALLARMQHDRDDAIATADRMREQSANAAREWSSRLADSPTREDLQAAGATIQLLTDVRSRLEHAGAELAGHADAARAAGLKCQADYGALTAH